MMGMDAQNNSKDGFDGLDLSIETHPDGTVKKRLRASTETILALTLLVGVVVSNGDARERVLDALPALAERFSGRFLAAG
jgi:hypothetical protein